MVSSYSPGVITINSTPCTLAPKFVQTTVSQGMEYYTDRTYTFTNVPTQYIGLNMIKTPNDDIDLTNATDYMTFKLQNDSTVYVAYDRRATSLPNWLSGFTDTGDTINTSLSTQQFLKVYRKNYAAGECVNFGANKAPGFSGGTVSNYVVFYRTLSQGFTAYNDLAWTGSQLSTNITKITSPNGGSGLPSSGELIDFNTGSWTGVTLTVTGGDFNGGSHATQNSGAPSAGTDAYNVFNGKLTAFGSASYQNISPPAGNLVLTFIGLNPGKLYQLVFYAHRNNYGWDRASLVTLSGATAFTNQSSVATDNPKSPNGALFSGPSSASTRIPADNDNGYVARFTSIASGSDGQVALIISFDGTSGFEYTGKYANAVMLNEQ